jgi:trimeric autotransporter adhesin
MKTKTLQLRNSVNRSQVRLAFVLIPFVLNCLALSPQARGTCQNGCDLSNTFLGEDGLISNTTGDDNTAIGFNALVNNTTGRDNTATGSQALLSNTTGVNNTASGSQALLSNTTGDNNTATGTSALLFSTTGDSNTATGLSALAFNTAGSFNTATGSAALYSNTTGDNNTATGFEALSSNTTGVNNTASGSQALTSNKTGDNNTATGSVALAGNTTGFDNTATGEDALRLNTTGTNNVANGYQSLPNNRSGSSNIAVGSQAGQNLTTGSNNIYIGSAAVSSDEHAKIRIGTIGTQRATFIAGISGATVPTGVAVIVDVNGHLGTTTSSARFKEAIKPMDKASEAILALKPVTFRYKHDLDPKGIAQFGLVAEEVEKVHPDLVVRDDEGKPYTVRYDAVNAMLLNEFLKEHAKVESLEKAMAEQRKENPAMRAMLKEQAAQIQKVSAQLELNKVAPQTVLNDQ